MSHSLLRVAFGLSLALFAFAPNTYVWGYNLTCCILFIFIIIIYYTYSKKSNYFDFDTIFTLSFGITFFIYPVLLYPIDPQYFVIFSFGFNENVITRATALSVLGYSSYILGRVKNISRISAQYSSYKRIKFYPFLYMTIIVFCILLSAGVLSSLRGLYDGSGGSQVSPLARYLGVIYDPLLIVTVVTQFYKLNQNKNLLNIRYVNKTLIVFLILQSVLMLSTGSRGGVLSIILVIVWLYSYYLKRIGKYKFLLIGMTGAVALSIIGVYRVGGNVDNFAFVDVFMDLIINNRNTFVAVDYVDNEGITFGKSMLACVFRVVPFLSSLMHNLLNLNTSETSSSILLTKETLGDDFTLGLGTSIIADLYLGFGVVGVIFFMWILGIIIKYLENKVHQNNIYHIIIYAVFISQAVYIVRSEYFFSLNQIVLCVFFYWLISKLTFNTKRHENSNSMQ